MEQISLEKYGIVILTGESCGYSLRLLCDYTKQGKVLLETFFSIHLHADVPNWNSGSDNSHIGSIMLPYTCMESLRIFITLQHYPVAMVTESGTVSGLTKEDFDEYSKHQKSAWFKKLRFYYAREQRNTHQMSGRVA
jgi:hypothetical protein